MTGKAINIVRIVLIDDHQLFREGIKRVLEMEVDIKVIAEGGNGLETEVLVAQHNPDVVIMDINLPDMNGIEVTKKLLKDYPNSKVLILSINDDETHVSRFLKAGAAGYMLKEMNVKSLIEAVKTVALGGKYIHPKVTRNLVKEFYRLANGNLVSKDKSALKEVEYEKPLHLLTKRECEVLQLITDGFSNRRIGDSLKISELTVKNHVSNILRKLDVYDRTNAVVKSIKNGWVKVN